MMQIKDKMQLFNVNRPKRGLINGLGSIIKSITGNLDSSDKERYDQIIENINNNENKLTNKINNMIKINNNITAQFNNKIKIINENNNILNRKLDSLEKTLSNIVNDVNIIKTQNLINELIQIAQELYYSVVSLEETMTFCQLNVLYFGIINHNELLKEINKLDDTFVKAILINNIHNNNILKTYCSVKSKKLVILIELPSNVLKEELLQVTSIPTYLHNTYETINVLNGLYTKNNCKIKPVNKCIRINNKEYYCLAHTNEYEKCIENVICYKDFQFCEYNKISPINSIIEIKNSNLKYLYFPNKKQAKFYCNNELNIKDLKGIYYTNNCKINNQIEMKSGFGELIEIHINSTNINIEHINEKIKNISAINYNPESSIQIESLYHKANINNYHYIVIYIVIILLIVIMLICKHKDYLKRIFKKSRNLEMQELNVNSKNVTSVLEEGGII